MGRIECDEIKAPGASGACRAVPQIAVDHPLVFLIMRISLNVFEDGSGWQEDGEADVAELTFFRDAQPVVVFRQESEKWIGHPRAAQVVELITAQSGQLRENAELGGIAAAPVLLIEPDLKTICICTEARHGFRIDR